MGDIKLYRPSNGQEGSAFMAIFCERCAKDDGEWGCPIANRAISLNIDHGNYPTEWQYCDDGEPTCAAFEATDA